jgi:hypothetical protein
MSCIHEQICFNLDVRVLLLHIEYQLLLSGDGRFQRKVSFFVLHSLTEKGSFSECVQTTYRRLKHKLRKDHKVRGREGITIDCKRTRGSRIKIHFEELSVVHNAEGVKREYKLSFFVLIVS